MKKTLKRYPENLVKLQDPKTLEKEGTAVGMYALHKNMAVFRVTRGYGIFHIVGEERGMYILNLNNDSEFIIKKSLVNVYI